MDANVGLYIMTFLEFLRKEKKIKGESFDIEELMFQYYDEYREFVRNLKDGCRLKEIRDKDTTRH